MNSWNEGYFTDSTYTYGYYRELSPNFMRWCLLVNGIAAPEITAETCHCELGFGQGLSANIHAAATPGKFFGTDFNPAHAAQAKEFAEASGADAHFFEDSFEEFAKRDDLPQFDSIGFHGVWTWISAENRRHMLEVARQHLKSGGMVYNSYNCLPGWAPAAPLRELLTLYDKNFHGNGNTQERVQAAINFIQEMIDAEPAYLQIAPSFKPTFEHMKKNSPDYIAHEYLNLDWDLMYFSDVAELSQETKLDFATQAVPIDGAVLHLSQKAQGFLGKISNPLVREQLTDYFARRQFRKDLYVRGIRRLPPPEVVDKLLAMRYVLLVPAAEVSMNVSTEQGVLKLAEGAYRPFVEYLAEDNHRPKDLLEYAARNNVPARNLIEMLRVLIFVDRVMPCQSKTAVNLVKKDCDRLNAHLCERAKFNEAINFLASPLTGCGFNVNRASQLFLAQYKGGVKTVDKLADEAFKILAQGGQRILFNGKPLENPEDNIKHLRTLAEKFFSRDLTIYKALLIA